MASAALGGEILGLEARLLGRAAYAVPPLVLLGFAALGLIVGRGEARVVTAGLEAGVPLAAGIAAASLVAGEPALELQLGMPGGYRPAALRRLAILFGWTSIVSFVGWLVADAAGLVAAWGPDVGSAAAQLTWLAPLAFFTAAGALAAIVLRGRAASAGLLGTLWVAGLVLKDPIAATPWLHAWYPFMTTFEPRTPDWVVTRLVLLVVAAILTASLAVCLRAGEWLLASEDA
jgi:hypothetical protein